MVTPLSHDEIARLRAATPGIAHTVHFNHGGASLPSAATLDAVQAQWQREASGPMEAGVAAREQSERARHLAAQLLNADPEEIALTAGNSPGWGAAFAALDGWRAGDRILVARHEWGGNLAGMRLAAQRHGLSVETIPSDGSGAVDPAALEAMLDARVKLISLTWLPANGGLINPAAAVGQVARRHGIPYFIDAAQAVGQVPVDVRALGCDVLSGAGRKALRGPRGTGLLYVRQDFLPRLVPAVVDTHSAPLDADGRPVLRGDAARFEPAETPMALRCGLGQALQDALDIGPARIRATIDATARALREQLGAVAGVRVMDQGREQSGLVSFLVEGRQPADVQRSLAAEGIVIGANGVPYTPLDMQARGLGQLNRASVSYLTTQAEMDRLILALRKLP